MSKLPKHLLGISDTDLEGMCVNCGLCCHAQVEVTKGVTALIPELRCKHLINKSDEETCCSVYENRQEVSKGWCYPLADAIEKGLFPKACPYVAEMTDYVGAEILPDPIYKSIRGGLVKSAIEKGQPDWAHPLDWAHFIYADDSDTDQK